MDLLGLLVVTTMDSIMVHLWDSHTMDDRLGHTPVAHRTLDHPMVPMNLRHIWPAPAPSPPATLQERLAKRGIAIASPFRAAPSLGL